MPTNGGGWDGLGLEVFEGRGSDYMFRLHKEAPAQTKLDLIRIYQDIARLGPVQPDQDA